MGHLRSNDRSINTYCTPVQDKNLPDHSTMNVAIPFVVLALVACAHSAPNGEEAAAPATSDTPSAMFEGDLAAIQTSLLDVKAAGEDLGVIEGKLEKLVTQKEAIAGAEKLLQDAVDKSGLVNGWKPIDDGGVDR